MRFRSVVLGLSLLGACAPENTWSSRVEDPGLPPILLEYLLRKPADFRLYDGPTRKEYALYFYEDEAVREEIVVVIDFNDPEGARRPRFATWEEHTYGLDLFQADWTARPQDARLKYFNERHMVEMRRKDSLIDQQIDFKNREIKHLRDKAHDIHSDLASRKDTSTFAEGDEKLRLAPTAALEAELKRTKHKLAVAETQLYLLEYKRSLRDLADSRHSGTWVEGRVGVDDLLPDYPETEELVKLVVRKVSPAAWDRPEARISVYDGELVVRQTRDVLVQVRDFVNRLRAEARAKLQEAGAK
jgi:hypothetical protein